MSTLEKNIPFTIADSYIHIAGTVPGLDICSNEFWQYLDKEYDKYSDDDRFNGLAAAFLKMACAEIISGYIESSGYDSERKQNLSVQQEYGKCRDVRAEIDDLGKSVSFKYRKSRKSREYK